MADATGTSSPPSVSSSASDSDSYYSEPPPSPPPSPSYSDYVSDAENLTAPHDPAAGYGPKPEVHPLDGEIADLTKHLDEISIHVQVVLSAQPRKTQQALSKATRTIFEKYEKHGVQARLSHDIIQFLEHGGGDDIEVKPLKAEGKGKSCADSSPFVTQARSTRSTDNRIIDEESRSLAADSELPFHPLDTIVRHSEDLILPDSYLEIIDRIFGLYAEEGKALLKHHTSKYGAHPIFRVGIREYLHSQLEKIGEMIPEDELGLTHETRTFLRAVFEQSPDINLAERNMLGRATRLEARTIELFWEDMTVRRRAYMGMRAFVAARELEMARQEG